MSGTATRRRFLQALAGALAAGVILLPVGGWSQTGGPARGGAPAFGRISGRVIDAATGRPVGRAPVRVQKRLARTDSSGQFVFDNVPAGNRVVTSDVLLPEGGFLGLFAKSVRYWGFTAEWVVEGKETGVTIALKKHGDVEETCRACHPDRPMRNLPVQKCLHHSGKELKPAMAAKVSAYNMANEKAKSEKKPYFPPIPLEDKKRPDGSIYHVYNCESCHTVHVPTAYRRYVLAPYLERSVLCEGCH